MQLKRRLMVVLAAVTLASSATIAATKVTVKDGDIISSLALKHHVTRNTIISANKLKNPDKLKLGQVLVIPSKADIKRAEIKHARALKLASIKAHKQALLAKHKKLAALKAKHNKAIASKAKAKTHHVASNKAAAKKVATSAQKRQGVIVSAKVVNTANRFKGIRYARGGSSRSGFDCSGFTRYVMRSSVGKTLPHNAAAQFNKGIPVSRAQLKPGDLVFFHTYSKGPSHVGIYVGKGNFVHASHPGSTVKTTSMNSGYYKNRFLGARRVSH